MTDGDEIVFRGRGKDGQIIDAPNPLFYNLKLAIACVMYSSGASGLIDELYGDVDDNDAIINQAICLFPRMSGVYPKSLSFSREQCGL